ncbi:MAG: hypothetical protein QOH46_4193 [Solirubrobacteraceae bacterium]|jgi:hypothetical protein|nr:hypothetical protein [Solirubrobacteraceae bacterium]
MGGLGQGVQLPTELRERPARAPPDRAAPAREPVQPQHEEGPGTLPATRTPVATAHAHRTTTIAGDEETMATTNSDTHPTAASAAIAPRTAAPGRRVPWALAG